MSVPDDEKGLWPTEDLPTGWEFVDFQGFLTDETDSRKKLPQKNYLQAGEIPVIDQGAELIGGYTNNKTLAYDGDLPVIVWGDHTKVIKFIDFPFVQGADGVKILKPKEGIEPSFAYQALRTISLPDKGYSRHFKFLKASSFPTPPLQEQRRIIEKLNNLLARSRSAREELARVPQLVERYKQAILLSAFNGRLTADWRTKNGQQEDLVSYSDDKLPDELKGTDFPKSWDINTLGIQTVNHDGQRRPVKASDRASRQGQYPYYGASGIIDYVNDYIFEGDYLLIAEDGANLVSRSTPIAFPASGKFWVNNHAHIIQPNSGVLQSYLEFYINWLDMTPYITGSAQPKLTQKSLNRIPIAVAPKPEQHEIINRLAAAFTRMDQLATEATRATALLDRLDQATLAKAFRGELVPQDPNDEPVMLPAQAEKEPRRKASKRKAA
jgi:type I restriction enzyme, S subunit